MILDLYTKINNNLLEALIFLILLIKNGQTITRSAFKLSNAKKMLLFTGYNNNFSIILNIIAFYYFFLRKIEFIWL